MIRNTTMFDSFLSAKVSKGTGAAIINMCARRMREDRHYKVRERDWNARMSFKTAKLLNMEEGCTNPRTFGPKGVPSMPYDEMVYG